MSNRFRETSSRWDWRKARESPAAPPARRSTSPNVIIDPHSDVSVAPHNSVSSPVRRKKKYKEEEKGFSYCSEDGCQVLMCGKDLKSSEVHAMSQVIGNATVINLSHNMISTIPHGLPSCLIALDLSHNKLSSLYGFESVQNLRELYLGGNSIERTWGLTVATALEILDLSANSIKLIEGLETLVNLKRLNLKSNLIKGLSALRSLSFNKALVVLDVSENPVCGHKNYKRNILHLLPSLEVLDDIKIGFDTFRKGNDYSTRYLNSKQFQESRSESNHSFLWSGRPGRWDGVVFKPGYTADHTAGDPKNFSEDCAGTDLSELYGTKQNAKKYPWRREPDIEPRPLHFLSAADEHDYKMKSSQAGSPKSYGASKTRSPSTSYIEMSRDDSYLNIVLSQHMERPEWNKYYKTISIGEEIKSPETMTRLSNKLGNQKCQQRPIRSHKIYSLRVRTEPDLHSAENSQQKSIMEFSDDNASPDLSVNCSDCYAATDDHASENSLQGTLFNLMEHKKKLLERLQQTRLGRS